MLGGGLNATEVYQEYLAKVIKDKPDRVYLAIIVDGPVHRNSLYKIGHAFRAAGISAYLFDSIDILDPYGHQADIAQKAIKTGRSAQINIVELDSSLSGYTNDERRKLISLDGIHMTESYHIILSKKWLQHLAASLN